MTKKFSINTKIIIVLSIAAILIVFSTNILPDLIDEDASSTSDEYHYETTFPVGRPSELQSDAEKSSP